MRLRTKLKRRQNPHPDATTRARKSIFSKIEKLSGSARVGRFESAMSIANRASGTGQQYRNRSRPAVTPREHRWSASQTSGDNWLIVGKTGTTARQIVRPKSDLSFV